MAASRISLIRMRLDLAIGMIIRRCSRAPTALVLPLVASGGYLACVYGHGACASERQAAFTCEILGNSNAPKNQPIVGHHLASVSHIDIGKGKTTVVDREGLMVKTWRNNGIDDAVKLLRVPPGEVIIRAVSNRNGVYGLTSLGHLFHWSKYTGWNPTPIAIDPSATMAIGSKANISSCGRGQEGKLLDIAAGDAHIVCLSSDGRAYALGDNTFGQCGKRQSSSSSTSSSSFFKSSTSNGSLFGDVNEDTSHYSSSTVGMEKRRSIRQQHDELNNLLLLREMPICATRDDNEGVAVRFVKVACGAAHTLLVSEGGEVYGCGLDRWMQLGHSVNWHNGSSFQTRLRRINNLHDSCLLPGEEVIQVACGADHSMCLTSHGNVYTWGLHKNGQLGRRLRTKYGEPMIVKGLPRKEQQGTKRGGDSERSVVIQEIASGKEHCVALDSRGELWGWGRNNYGQLGRDNERIVWQPMRIAAPAKKGCNKQRDKEADFLSPRIKELRIEKVYAGNWATAILLQH